MEKIVCLSYQPSSPPTPTPSLTSIEMLLEGGPRLCVWLAVAILPQHAAHKDRDINHTLLPTRTLSLCPSSRQCFSKSLQAPRLLADGLGNHIHLLELVG